MLVEHINALTHDLLKLSRVEFSTCDHIRPIQVTEILDSLNMRAGLTLDSGE